MHSAEHMVSTFAGLRPGATFVGVNEYTNLYNELSTFGIVFHIDYKKSLKNSLDIVYKFKPNDLLHKEAKRLLIASLIGRIDAFSRPLEKRDSPYVYFKDANKTYIKGIKMHEETEDLYMFGFVVSKKILAPTKYIKINSEPLTLAKNRIENLTPVSKFRQFRLIPKSYKEIKIENLIIN